MSFKYDFNGIKTKKTVNVVDTEYFYVGDTLVSQKTGEEVINFAYTAGGAPYGFTYNGTSYFYLTNIQGDIIGIYDANGNVVVEYTYDSWGKLISITGSMASTIGVKNPLRYRGYYYDTETSLYYLQARYYDPDTGRFISADALLVAGNDYIQGMNRYAYCYNNPVMYVDPTGYNTIAADPWTFESLFAAILPTITVTGSLNPGVIAAIVVVIVGVAIVYATQKELIEAQELMDYASTAATPPPPNQGGNGTQVTSKTLYNKSGKKGYRIDVENPGNRPGQIHLQKDGVKYYYNIKDQTFRIGSSSGEMAPKAIQELLNEPKVIKAIGKGLKILGY